MRVAHIKLCKGWHRRKYSQQTEIVRSEEEGRHNLMCVTVAHSFITHFPGGFMCQPVPPPGQNCEQNCKHSERLGSRLGSEFCSMNRTRSGYSRAGLQRYRNTADGQWDWPRRDCNPQIQPPDGRATSDKKFIKVWGETFFFLQMRNA